jgi:hypothetical protein
MGHKPHGSTYLISSSSAFCYVGVILSIVTGHHCAGIRTNGSQANPSEFGAAGDAQLREFVAITVKLLECGATGDAQLCEVIVKTANPSEFGAAGDI